MNGFRWLLLILMVALPGWSTPLEDRLLEMADDPDPRVRFQVALTLGSVDSPGKVPALTRIALRDSGDEWVRSALLSSVRSDAIDLYTSVVQEWGALPEQGSLTEEGLADLVESLAKIVGTRRNPEEIGKLLGSLVAAKGNQSEEIAIRSLKGMSEGLQLAEGGGMSDPAIEEALVALLASSSEAVGQQTKLVAGSLLTGGSKGIEESVHSALGRAQDENLVPAERVRAIETLRLGELPLVGPVLGTLLETRHPEAVSLAALETLSSFAGVSVGALLIEHWRGMGPAVREKALESLFSRKERLAQLLTAIEEGRLQSWTVDLHRQSLLRQFPDPGIAEWADRVFSFTHEGEDPDLLATYSGAIDLPGDAEKGREIYRIRCTLCHKVGEEGVQLGPDWSSVQSNTRETLLVSILYPNRALNPGFTDYVIETTGGNVVNGIISQSGDNSITLRRAGGEEETILRKNIASIRDTKLSIMPVGLQAGLSVQDMADLLSFIQSLQ